MSEREPDTASGSLPMQAIIRLRPGGWRVVERGRIVEGRRLIERRRLIESRRLLERRGLVERRRIVEGRRGEVVIRIRYRRNIVPIGVWDPRPWKYIGGNSTGS